MSGWIPGGFRVVSGWIWPESSPAAFRSRRQIRHRAAPDSPARGAQLTRPDSPARSARFTSAGQPGFGRIAFRGSRRDPFCEDVSCQSAIFCKGRHAISGVLLGGDGERWQRMQINVVQFCRTYRKSCARKPLHLFSLHGFQVDCLTKLGLQYSEYALATLFSVLRTLRRGMRAVTVRALRGAAVRCDFLRCVAVRLLRGGACWYIAVRCVVLCCGALLCFSVRFGARAGGRASARFGRASVLRCAWLRRFSGGRRCFVAAKCSKLSVGLISFKIQYFATTACKLTAARCAC